MASGILTWTVPGHGMPGTGWTLSETFGWTPVLGDWNGDGKTETGVTNGQTWYLDHNGDGAWTPVTDNAYSFGSPGWTPVVGKWG